MNSMAQAFARGGIVSKEEADRIDSVMAGRRRRLDSMVSKVYYLEIDLYKFEQAFNQIDSDSNSSGDLKKTYKKKVDDAKFELQRLKNSIIELSGKIT